MRPWIFAIAWILGISGGLGCDTAKAAFDCQAVCSHYQSCFDSNYDVSACRNRCRAKADNDNTWQNKASDCASCIDDKSCTSATFNCATECVGIVP